MRGGDKTGFNGWVEAKSGERFKRKEKENQKKMRKIYDRSVPRSSLIALDEGRGACSNKKQGRLQEV